ncbi:MAG TPA: hypothetical protein VN636_15340 [Acidimicrobiia bacterium]|nr:hypothetical protein [Acidimicrobiia bacterium]
MAVAVTRSDVAVDRPSGLRTTRRAADVLRLIAASSVLLATLLLSAVAHSGVKRTERSMLESIITLPAPLRDLLTGLAQLVLILVPVGIVVLSLVRRQFSLLGQLVVTTIIATLAAVVAAHLLLQTSHPETWHQLLAGRGGAFDATFPPVAWLCGATAVVTVTTPELTRGWRTALWWTITIAAVIEVIVGGSLPVDAVVAAALGLTVGSLALLAFGAPSNRPEAAEIVDALHECGIDVEALVELAAAPGDPALFGATTRDGTKLSVRVFADDDANQSLLLRQTRRLLLRNPQDDRLATTVESAAEHELLATVTAERAGARVPQPVVAYPVGTRHGRRGALVAWTTIDGRRMDQLAQDEISDATLRDLWKSVQHLREHRLAHRTLRTEHVYIDPSGQAWLTGFALAELGASETLLDNDVAELLASLALQVGVDRAIASAVAGGSRLAFASRRRRSGRNRY